VRQRIADRYIRRTGCDRFDFVEIVLARHIAFEHRLAALNVDVDARARQRLQFGKLRCRAGRLFGLWSRRHDDLRTRLDIMSTLVNPCTLKSCAWAIASDVAGSSQLSWNGCSAMLSPTTKELQALLADDEALVLFAQASDTQSYIVAFTRKAYEWKPIPLGGRSLAQKVAAFRRGLDVDMVENQSYLDSINEKRELFDLSLANELYQSLFGAVDPTIKDKQHLIVVPFGPLTALPFHLPAQ
jgi:hypothetical protein